MRAMYNLGFSLEVLTDILLEHAHSFLPSKMNCFKNKHSTKAKLCRSWSTKNTGTASFTAALPRIALFSLLSMCSLEIHPQILVRDLYFLFVLLTSGMGNS